MDTRINRAYEFADLSGYSVLDRWKIRAADWAFYLLINLIGLTARFEVIGWENHDKAEENGGLPIYVFWHDRIFLTTYWWRKRRIVVMTSRSFDGEYIARFIQRFGYGAARGSSTRARASATRCFSPPDRRAGGTVRRCETPAHAIASSSRRSRTSAGARRSFNP